MPLPDAIGAFITDQQIAGRAAWTCRKHRQELERFRAWLDTSVLDWRTVTRRELKTFIRLRAGLGVSARAAMICSLRVFYAFDPHRQAVLLIGGDKTGDDRFYEVMVPRADALFDAYLAEHSTPPHGRR